MDRLTSCTRRPVTERQDARRRAGTQSALHGLLLSLGVPEGYGLDASHQAAELRILDELTQVTVG